MTEKVLVDGQEVELSDEAVQELKDKAIAEFKEANPDVDSLEDIKAELEAEKLAREELETRAKEKDGNLAGSRKALEAKDAKIAELETKMTGAVESIKTFVTSGVTTRLLTGLSGGDKDVADKIQHYVDNELAAMPTTTEAEITAKYAAAAQLATGAAPRPEVLSGQIVSSGNIHHSAPSAVSADVAEAAGLFGLSAEDIKKYGGTK